MKDRRVTSRQQLLGKTVKWHALAEVEGLALQALCSLPIPGEQGLVAHVIIDGANDPQILVMRKAAETLKLVKPREPAAK